MHVHIYKCQSSVLICKLQNSTHNLVNGRENTLLAKYNCSFGLAHPININIYIYGIYSRLMACTAFIVDRATERILFTMELHIYISA